MYTILFECYCCDDDSDLILVCVFFFFQAEDGIRDLVRSRGLGDVYKRQRHDRENCERDDRENESEGRPHFAPPFVAAALGLLLSLIHI